MGIPGCLRWLVDRGHEVIGIELVERAVDELHAARGVAPEVTRDGAVTVYRSPGMTVLCGDLFTIAPGCVAPADRVWDRGALVALPPDRRGAYVACLRAMVAGDWQVLLNAVTYDPAVMDGPPFSLTERDVRALYADCHVEVLCARDVIDEVSWRERGHTYWIHTTYLISGTTRREGAADHAS